MSVDPFMTVKRDSNGRFRIRGTDANTSAVDDALNSSLLMSDAEADALLFQAERDDLPEYDPDGDEP